MNARQKAKRYKKALEELKELHSPYHKSLYIRTECDVVRFKTVASVPDEYVRHMSEEQLKQHLVKQFFAYNFKDAEKIDQFIHIEKIDVDMFHDLDGGLIPAFHQFEVTAMLAEYGRVYGG